ncbi:MAG: aldehyde dehydrogenase [Actinobacteria bacterium]|nr:aldehyde dehydrogenase [Actinomycetota bacterium]
MAIDEKQIEKIVRGVVESLLASSDATSLKVSPLLSSQDGLFDDIDDAIASAKRAQNELVSLGREKRFKIIEAIRKASLENKERLARLAVDETKMGRYEDKIIKNEVAATRSVGPEDLEVKTYRGDEGTIIIDRAPFGVIAAIEPMTNPTACTINAAIVMISGGNSVVFLPHPSAHRCTTETVKIIHRAIVEAGGPLNLVTAARESKIENVQKAFKNDDVSMIVATGGPGIVRLSLKSGKKVIGAGPGNPPVIVDDTCDVEKAARDIEAGASFDNNILCNEEKVIICMKASLEELLSAFAKGKTVVLTREQAQRVTSLVVKDGEIVKEYMGKDASVILSQAGISVDPSVRLAVFVAESESHPLVQHEQLMPVLPILVVDTFEEAIEVACRVEHGFGHTALIHTRDMNRVTMFGQAIGTTNLIVNGPSQAMAAELSRGGTSWTIAGPTGEGCTTPRTFTRERRLVISGSLNFVK